MVVAMLTLGIRLNVASAVSMVILLLLAAACCCCRRHRHCHRHGRRRRRRRRRRPRRPRRPRHCFGGVVVIVGVLPAITSSSSAKARPLIGFVRQGGR